MSIPEQTLEQINDLADLVGIIGKHTTLKPSGKSFKGCCPFHKEKSPSFYVHPHEGYYYCFGCKESGNAISFLMNYEHLSFLEAAEQLAAQTGVQLPKFEASNATRYPLDHKTLSAARGRDVKPKSTQPSGSNANAGSPPPKDQDANSVGHKTTQTGTGSDASSQANSANKPIFEPIIDGDLYELLEQICSFYQAKLKTQPKALVYLNQRGLSERSIDDFRLGYAPAGWDHLEAAFEGHVEGLKKLGLIRLSDRGQYNLLRDRVIFPIRDTRGRVIGFGGRALSPDDKAKYINSPESVVFHKGQHLYGLFEARSQSFDQWLVVEGYLDVISLHQAGIFGAVASMGTAISDNQIERLFRSKPVVTMAFDGDSAGQTAAMRALQTALPKLGGEHQLKFLTLPGNQDPDSYVREQGAQNLISAIKQSANLSDFLYAVLTQGTPTDTPEGKNQVIARAQRITQSIPKSSNYGYLLIKDLKERLGLGFVSKKQKEAAKDALLNFGGGFDTNQTLFFLFLLQPTLAMGSGDLMGLLKQDDPLATLMELVGQHADQLKQVSPAEQCLFLLGCWPKPKQAAPLARELERFYKTYFAGSETALTQGELISGDFDPLMNELVLTLSAKRLRELRRQASDLEQIRSLSERLAVIEKQLHFRAQDAP